MVSPSLVSVESGENSAPDRGGKGSERAAEAVGQRVCIDLLALDRLGVSLEAVARQPMLGAAQAAQHSLGALRTAESSS